MATHSEEGGDSGMFTDNPESSVTSEPEAVPGIERVSDVGSLAAETEKISGDLRLSGETNGALVAL